MYKQLRQIIRDIYPNIKGKSGWTASTEEIAEIIRKCLPANSVTVDNVELLLRMHKIDYATDKTSSEYSVIRCSLMGPTIWTNFLPSGSKYDVAFRFKSNLLQSIDAYMMELHL